MSVKKKQQLLLVGHFIAVNNEVHWVISVSPFWNFLTP